MTLADYSTAAEKIAALKCAQIDPALVNLETGTLNVSEDIYLITWLLKINTLKVTGGTSFACISPKLSSGDTLDPYLSGYAYMYIKDSEITYSDPITLYQNRLSKIIEANLKVVNWNGFTVGANSALIISTDEDPSTLKFNGNSIIDDFGVPATPLYIPVQSGYVITNTYTPNNITYINLPADW